MGNTLDQDLPRPGAVEFAEEDRLPGTQNQASPVHEECLGSAEQGCLDVGGGISFHMPVSIMQGNDLVQLGQNIFRHIGVCVFIDGDGGGGVGNKEMTHPLPHSRFSSGLPVSLP